MRLFLAVVALIRKSPEEVKRICGRRYVELTGAFRAGNDLVEAIENLLNYPVFAAENLGWFHAGKLARTGES